MTILNSKVMILLYDNYKKYSTCQNITLLLIIFLMEILFYVKIFSIYYFCYRYKALSSWKQIISWVKVQFRNLWFKCYFDDVWFVTKNRENLSIMHLKTFQRPIIVETLNQEVSEKEVSWQKKSEMVKILENWSQTFS